MITMGGITITPQAIQVMNQFRNQKVANGRIWLDGREVDVQELLKGNLMFIAEAS